MHYVAHPCPHAKYPSSLSILVDMCELLDKAWTFGGVYVPYDYLVTFQVRVNGGDSGLCCCAGVMSFQHGLTPSLCWFLMKP